MKIKSFAIFTLLAASFVYVAPTMADNTNMNTNDQSMQQSDENNINNVSSSSNMGSSNDISDQNTPDTATGDDDY